jgi:mono/diheme cytochrome c family protein
MLALALSVSSLLHAGASIARGKHHHDEEQDWTPLTSAETQHAQTLFGKTCAGCHGADRAGKIGPSLLGVGSRYSAAKIERIILQGKAKRKAVAMPAGLVSAEEAKLLARWLIVAPHGADRQDSASATLYDS